MKMLVSLLSELKFFCSENYNCLPFLRAGALFYDNVGEFLFPPTNFLVMWESDKEVMATVYFIQ